METPNHTPEPTAANAPRSLKDSVLARIQQGDTTMRSKSYFTAKVVALIVVTLAVLAVSITICNFIFFSLRINAPDALFGFGQDGVLAFLAIFPWTLLVLDILLIAILEWLLRQFRFGYRSPMIYLLLGILVIVFSLSFFIDRGTHINDDLLNRADQHQLPPPLRGFIEDERHPPPPGTNLYKAQITGMQGNTLQVIVLGTTTPYIVVFRPGQPIGRFEVGDAVLVSGHSTGNTIHADGIQPLPPNALPPPGE